MPSKNGTATHSCCFLLYFPCAVLFFFTGWNFRLLSYSVTCLLVGRLSITFFIIDLNLYFFFNELFWYLYFCVGIKQGIRANRKKTNYMCKYQNWEGTLNLVSVAACRLGHFLKVEPHTNCVSIYLFIYGSRMG